MSAEQKPCIPNGTFEGAVGSLEVSENQIIFHRENMDKPMTIDWNGELGEFSDIENQGIMIVNVDRVRIEPKEINPSFPRVGKTDFFFVNGVYDGDGNEMNSYVAKKKKILNKKRREWNARKNSSSKTSKLHQGF